MIQRIQSIYLLMVSLFSGGLIFLLKLGNTVEQAPVYTYKISNTNILINPGILIGFIVVALLAAFSIFFYKNRKIQLILNHINILINIILLGLLSYYLLNLSGENEISEKGIGGFLPFVSIILLLLANKAIKKDEDLVKSVDRLR